MSKALIPLALVALFIPLAAAQDAEPANPLAGAKSVFINADMSVKREMRMVLAKQLPHLKFPSKAKDADVVLEIRNNLNETRLDNRSRSQVVFRGGSTSSGTAAQPTTAVRADQPNGARMIIQGTFGVAVKGPVTLVVHKGVPSPFFPTQFANEVVKAYHEANPEETK